MFPLQGSPSKSLVSQPLVDVLPRPEIEVDPVTAAVTSPGSDWSITPKSTSSTYVTAFGARLLPEPRRPRIWNAV